MNLYGAYDLYRGKRLGLFISREDYSPLTEARNFADVSDEAWDIALKMAGGFALALLVGEAMGNKKLTARMIASSISTAAQEIDKLTDDFAFEVLSTRDEDEDDDGEAGAPVQPVKPSPFTGAADAVVVEEYNYEEPSGAMRGCDCEACADKRKMYTAKQMLSKPVVNFRPFN